MVARLVLLTAALTGLAVSPAALPAPAPAVSPSVAPAVRTALSPAAGTAPVPLVSRAPGSAGVRAGARAAQEADQEQGARWRWPVAPRPPVLARYRAPAHAYGAGHRGLDLGAAAGAPVLAVEAGTVTHVGVVAGRGTVTVTHADGLASTYEPVQGTVHVGDRVLAGAPLGTISGTSHCGSACLHLGARRARTYVDPWPLLVRAPVILLPMG